MKYEDLERMFNPKSIAVVGAKQPDPKFSFKGMFGSIYDFGYKGMMYPINPKLKELEGFTAYPDMLSLPEQVDLVIVSVPAPVVPGVLRECAQSGNKNVHIFTAGFKETGESNGLALQKEIEEIAFGNDLNVIGPNCMGICVPEIRIGTWLGPVKKVGPVSFISQSGGHAQDFSNYAASMGVGFSKIVSYGNALTIDSTDFLEYFAQDPKTEIITMYLEGVKDGRKLMRLVKEINRKKPILIVKGGLTESGTKAVASHTGSMAGSEHFWNAFFRQTGAIRANSLEEMAHATLALLRLKETKGRGVSVMGTGGGVMVAISDTCSKAGLELPPFSEPVQKSLREFVPEAGNMIKNPLDAHPILLMADTLLPKTMDLIYQEPDINMVIISLHADWLGEKFLPGVTSAIKTLCPKHLKDKPFVVSWRQTRHDPNVRASILEAEKELLEAKIPVYKSFEYAATALSKFADYHMYRQRIEK